MATISILWPADYEQEANDYADWANARWAEVAPGDLFCDPPVLDAHGQWRLPFYGPPYITEPEGGPAMRPHGVISNTWDPPEE